MTRTKPITHLKSLNNFSALAEKYQISSLKPDKLYSTLPTVLRMAGNLRRKTVLDLGCGNGFFSEAFSNNGATQVIGIDNSRKQLQLAQKTTAKNVIYKLGDLFQASFPKVDIVNAPYVINYAKDTVQLQIILKNIHACLTPKGEAILVVDLPEGKNLKKFGARKTIIGKKRDGAKIKIELFSDDKNICTLSSIYFTPKTLINTLRNVGFKKIVWHKQIVSKEGIKKFGASFWKGYTKHSELGYLSAQK